MALLALVVQAATEWLQLWRLGRQERALSYFFPGVEFVVAAIGIVLAAVGNLWVPSDCQCEIVSDPYRIALASGVVTASFVYLMFLEGTRAGGLIKVNESGTYSPPIYLPSFYRPSYWGGLLVLLLVSALLA